MPLEALREPVTPIGLHYLLIHYDIPHVDATTWRLNVDGNVDEPALARSRRSACASARTRSSRRWSAQGTAARARAAPGQPAVAPRGGRDRPLARRAPARRARTGRRAGAVEVLFTGLDRGIEGGEEQAFQRSLPLDRRARRRGAARLRAERRAAATSTRLPAPPCSCPGWYGMTNVKWLDAHHARRHRSRATSRHADTASARTRTTRAIRSRESSRGADGSPGIPDFMNAADEPRPRGDRRPAWSGLAPVAEVEFSADDGARGSPASAGRARPWHGVAGPRVGTDDLAAVVACRARDAAGNEQPSEQVWNVGGYANNQINACPSAFADVPTGARYRTFGEPVSGRARGRAAPSSPELRSSRLRGLELGLRVFE